MIFSENEKAANAAFLSMKPVSVMFYRMIVLNIFWVLRLKRRRTTEEHRYEEDGENGRRDHTTITPVPTAFCAPGPRRS